MTSLMNPRSQPTLTKMTLFKLARFAAVAFALTPHLTAQEPDIMELVQVNPLNITTSAGKPKYGDPDLDEAVYALADIPRPWTVPKIIEAFNHSPWDEERRSHLATLLAASRDPRAAVILIKALEYHSTAIVHHSRTGLYYYFLPDARYRRLPPDPKEQGIHFYTNFIPEMDRRVRAWWALNKDDITSSISNGRP
jgi:hypothetical protein